MRCRPNERTLRLLASTILIFLFISLGSFAGFDIKSVAAQTGTTRLSGYVPDQLRDNPAVSVLNENTLAGFSASSKPLYGLEAQGDLTISVALKLRQKDELLKLVQAQGTPGSAQYRKFLTPQQFIDRYAPTQAQYDEVVAFLQAGGLQISQTSKSRLTVEAHGKLTQISRLFQTRFATFEGDSRTYFGLADEPTVPAKLAGQIAFIGGLTNYLPYVKRQSVIAPANETPSAEQSRQFYSPTQFRKAYNSQSLIDQGINGKGTTIGVLLFDAYYRQSEIDAFSQRFNLPNKTVRVVGQLRGPDDRYYDPDSYVETNLDLQWTHASAPEADIVLYSQKVNSDADFLRIFQSLAEDNKADVANLSFGGPENRQGNVAEPVSNFLLQAAVQGTSIFVASGDNGLYNEIGFRNGDPNKEVASFPATLPFVTAVGGTRLDIDFTNDNILGEKGWSFDPSGTSRSDQEKASSGGGISGLFARPDYQRPTSFNPEIGRAIPDISANADPATGYYVVVSRLLVTGSGADTLAATLVGGTSASAPLWAGFGALLVQKAGARLGLLNPFLYDLNYSSSRDVLEGFNGRSANAGFDLVTGLGVPRIDVLAAFLPDTVHAAPLPPRALFFERVNPNVSVTPGGIIEIVVGIHNESTELWSAPEVTVPLPNGAKLLSARFTSSDGAVTNLDASNAKASYGKEIKPHETVTGFFKILLPFELEAGSVIVHRSVVSWQTSSPQTFTTNKIDLTVGGENVTDTTQDGVFAGSLSDTGLLTDDHFSPNEPLTLLVVGGGNPNLTVLPAGRVDGNLKADGDGKISLQLLPDNWPPGDYVVVVQGNWSGVELGVKFSK